MNAYVYRQQTICIYKQQAFIAPGLVVFILSPDWHLPERPHGCSMGSMASSGPSNLCGSHLRQMEAPRLVWWWQMLDVCCSIYVPMLACTGQPRASLDNSGMSYMVFICICGHPGTRQSPLPGNKWNPSHATGFARIAHFKGISMNLFSNSEPRLCATGVYTRYTRFIRVIYSDAMQRCTASANPS